MLNTNYRKMVEVKVDEFFLARQFQKGKFLTFRFYYKLSDQNIFMSYAFEFYHYHFNVKALAIPLCGSEFDPIVLVNAPLGWFLPLASDGLYSISTDECRFLEPKVRYPWEFDNALKGIMYGIEKYIWPVMQSIQTYEDYVSYLLVNRRWETQNCNNNNLLIARYAPDDFFNEYSKNSEEETIRLNLCDSPRFKKKHHYYQLRREGNLAEIDRIIAEMEGQARESIVAKLEPNLCKPKKRKNPQG